MVVIHGTVPTLVTMTFSALSLELERKHGKLYTGVCRQVEQSSISVIFSHLLCHPPAAGIRRVISWPGWTSSAVPLWFPEANGIASSIVSEDPG